MITNAARSSDLYRSIQELRGHPPDWQVLPLSCFAVTVAWPPGRLAENTGFRSYLQEVLADHLSGGDRTADGRRTSGCVMHADAPDKVLAQMLPIHPTVAELYPTILGQLEALM